MVAEALFFAWAKATSAWGVCRRCSSPSQRIRRCVCATRTSRGGRVLEHHSDRRCHQSIPSLWRPSRKWRSSTTCSIIARVPDYQCVPGAQRDGVISPTSPGLWLTNFQVELILTAFEEQLAVLTCLTPGDLSPSEAVRSVRLTARRPRCSVRAAGVSVSPQLIFGPARATRCHVSHA